MEVCPLKAAHDQIEVLFWGAVHICKEVRGSPTCKTLNMLYNVSQVIQTFHKINCPGEGRHIFNVTSAGGYFCPTLNPILCCCQVWYVFVDLIYLQLLIWFFCLPRSFGRIYRIAQKGDVSRVEHSSNYNRTWRLQHRLEKYGSYTSPPSI